MFLVVLFRSLFGTFFSRSSAKGSNASIGTTVELSFDGDTEASPENILETEKVSNRNVSVSRCRRVPTSTRTLASCLKRNNKSSTTKNRHVTFSTKVDTIPASKDYLSDLDSMAESSHDYDVPSTSHIRDKTLLLTDPRAWCYAMAYDDAYVSFVRNCKTTGNSSSSSRRWRKDTDLVERRIQQVLIHGIDGDFLTLERFARNYKIRQDMIQQIRQSIIEKSRMVRCSGVEEQPRGNGDTTTTTTTLYCCCWEDELAAYCADQCHVSEQWARFMGHIMYMASKVDYLEPLSTRSLWATPPPRMEKKNSTSSRRSWSFKNNNNNNKATTTSVTTHHQSILCRAKQRIQTARAARAPIIVVF